MVGLQAMVLGRMGGSPPLIQERVLYPAHRHLRAGALRGPALYNACIVGRVVLPALVTQRGLRFAPPSALRGTSGGATMTTPGGAGTTTRCSYDFLRARRTGFYHRVGVPPQPHRVGLRPLCFSNGNLIEIKSMGVPVVR